MSGNGMQSFANSKILVTGACSLRLVGRALS